MSLDPVQIVGNKRCNVRESGTNGNDDGTVRPKAERKPQRKKKFTAKPTKGKNETFKSKVDKILLLRIQVRYRVLNAVIITQLGTPWIEILNAIIAERWITCKRFAWERRMRLRTREEVLVTEHMKHRDRFYKILI